MFCTVVVVAFKYRFQAQRPIVQRTHPIGARHRGLRVCSGSHHCFCFRLHDLPVGAPYLFSAFAAGGRRCRTAAPFQIAKRRRTLVHYYYSAIGAAENDTELQLQRPHNNTNNIGWKRQRRFIVVIESKRTNRRQSPHRQHPPRSFSCRSNGLRTNEEQSHCQFSQTVRGVGRWKDEGRRAGRRQGLLTLSRGWRYHRFDRRGVCCALQLRQI